MSEVLIVFARYSSIGILCAVCGLLLINRLRPPITVYALLFSLCSICLLLVSGSPPWSIGGPIAVPLILFSNLIFVFAWRFGLAIFDDDIKLGWIGWSILAFFIVGPALDMAKNQPWFPIQGLNLQPMRLAYVAICFGLMLHLAYRAYRGRADDLIEARRLFRVGFCLLMSIVMISIIITTEYSRRQNALDTSFIFLLAPLLSMALALWSARLNPQTIALEAKKIGSAQSKNSVESAFQSPEMLSLEKLMMKEKVFREHGLTVTKLAEQMNMRERKLREFINKTLGYRNFSSFLNEYRIEDAKKKLSDPDCLNLPILTIAYDAGFASISPFNAAFKSATGHSPSAFRKTSPQSMTSFEDKAKNTA